MRQLPYPQLGSGKIIFVEHMGDLFANGLPPGWRETVLMHCLEYPGNKYVFQSKNTSLMYYAQGILPPRRMIGTTIETNREDLLNKISKAPAPIERMRYMVDIKGEKFVTIEPIMEFDLGSLLAIIINCKPLFINIGADSKGHNLPEPKRAEVIALIEAIKANGIEVKQKSNLKRLIGDAGNEL